MRYLLILLFTMPSVAWAQSLERNEVDKYLKISIKETSWENFSVKFTSACAQRISNKDGTIYFELSVSLQSAFRVDEGDKIYFLLDNDESLPIECTRGGVANYKHSKYESHWNGKYLYKLDEQTIQTLLKHKVVGVRIGMGSEYTTFDNVKEKNAKKLQKAITLVI